MNTTAYHPETLAVQAGYDPGNGDPRVCPIVQSTTYKYDDAQSVADLFDLKAAGFFYTRLANPTVDALEKRLAALEGGVSCVCTASGQSANALSIMNVAASGDHVVAVSSLYGGTVSLFSNTLKKCGIDFTFVLPSSTEEQLNAAFRDIARLLAEPEIDGHDFAVFQLVSLLETAIRSKNAVDVDVIDENPAARLRSPRPLSHQADAEITVFRRGHGVAELFPFIGNLWGDNAQSVFSVVFVTDIGLASDFHGIGFAFQLDSGFDTIDVGAEKGVCRLNGNQSRCRECESHKMFHRNRPFLLFCYNYT